MRSARHRSVPFRRALPALLVMLLAAPAAVPADDEQPPAVVYESLETVYRLENDGTGTTRVLARSRIVTEEGRQASGQFYVPYREGRSRVEIGSVVTVKPDGRRVEADLSQVLDVSPQVQPEAPVYTDVRFKVVPVAALQVGDVLETEHTIRVHSPLKPGEFWITHYLTEAFPVEASSVVLDVPADRELAFAADGGYEHREEIADGRRVHTWTLPEREAFRGWGQPPRVFAVSTFTSWAELGRWLRGLVDAPRESTPELEALAARLVEGRDTPRARVEAIYAHVATSIRYRSLSLGIGGYRPHAPADVLRNEYGDCKDKHLLLATLLGLAGIESHAAVVHSAVPPLTDVPTPDEFDHMVTVVRLDEGPLWLDSTLEVAPPGFLLPTIRGEHALVLTDGEPGIVEVPEAPAVASYQRATLRGTLDASGGLDATLSVTARGAGEMPLRSLARGAPADGLADEMRYALPWELWEAEIDSATTADPRDLSRPFEVELAFRAPAFLDSSLRNVSRHVPTVAIDPPALPFWTDEDSEDDITLAGPYERTERVEIALGDAYIAHLPPGTEASDDFGSYRSRYELTDGSVVATRVLRVEVRTLAASRRSDLEAFSTSVGRDLEKLVMFVRTAEPEPEPVDILQGGDADALNWAGFQALQRDDTERALELLLRATELDPDHPYAWGNLGRAHAALGDVDAAQGALERQVEIDPSNPDVNAALGAILAIRNDTEGSVAAFRRRLEAAPDDATALTALCAGLVELERWDEALGVCGRAVEASPSRPELRVAYGSALIASGRHDEGRAAFDAALELDPGENVLNEVAYAMAERELDLDAALALAESAIARTELELRLIRSLQGWMSSYTTQRQCGAYLDTYGWILFKQGKLDAARQALTTALELDPGPVIATHLAEAAAAAGDPDAALDGLAYAAFVRGDETPDVPESLRALVAERFPDESRFAGWIDDRRAELATRTTVVGTGPAWPDGAATEAPVDVTLATLVAASGEVLEARAIGDESEWARAAAAGAAGLSFEPLRWRTPLRTIRLLRVTYRPGGEVRVRELLPDEAVGVVFRQRAQAPAAR